MRQERAWAVTSALFLGAVSGWLTARAGGSLERAPMALLVVGIGLSGTGGCSGVPLGIANDRLGLPLVAVLASASYYLGTWVASPFHSLVGDLLLITVSLVPLGVGAVAGFLAGQAIARLRTR